MKKIIALIFLVLGSAMCVEAGVLSRLYDFEPGDVIYSQEVDDEFNQIVEALSGVSSSKYIWVKNSHGTDPVCRFDQLGAGPIAEFKKSGTTKVSINNSGQIVSGISTGTSPLSVTSTTLNTNLNADLLDGLDSTELATGAGSVQTETISDGPGTPSATITVTEGMVKVDCQDLADGCSVDVDTTGVDEGRMVTLVMIGVGGVGISDNGVSLELAGDFTGAHIYDTLTLRFVIDRWVEVSRSNN